MISFCWHEWAAWSGIVPTHTTPKQFKYCKKCNKIKHRVVAFDNLAVNTGVWNHEPGQNGLSKVE